MPALHRQRPKWRTYLALGRVSNLPTCWSNVLAGMILAGGHYDTGFGLRDGRGQPLDPARLSLVPAAVSLFYVGGMFLNDAFDREIDARDHPERPIPSGAITSREVFAVGFGLLIAGLASLVYHVASGGAGGPLLLGAGAALAGAIVLYDSWHKANLFGPLLMGICRMLVYVVAALSVSGEVPALAWAGAAVLLCYLIGLTYAAKQETLTRFENFWPLLFLAVPFAYAPLVHGADQLLLHPLAIAVYLGFLAWTLYALSLLVRRAPGNIPRAVVSLIAGISLLDALLMATQHETAPVALGALAFAFTLFLQRYVRGT